MRAAGIFSGAASEAAPKDIKYSHWREPVAVLLFLCVRDSVLELARDELFENGLQNGHIQICDQRAADQQPEDRALQEEAQVDKEQDHGQQIQNADQDGARDRRTRR